MVLAYFVLCGRIVYGNIILWGVIGMENLLYEFNPWWEEDYNFHLKTREKYIRKIREKLKTNRILLLAGLRRVGKSSIMKLMIKSLLEKAISKENILYVSLDDFLLDDKSIIEILEVYRKIMKLKKEEHVYLFFDEITYKEKWQQQLKNLYDRENCVIIASSSSSSVFSDSHAYLTGRSIIIEVEPLDFEEWLLFKNVNLAKRDSNLLESYFEDFLNSGGMPEYVLNNDRDYLQNLIEQLLYKDIIAKHNIKMQSVIRDMFLLLMERAGKQISITKIGKILGISASNAKRYLEYFEQTFLIYLVGRYGKTNEQILSPRKLYAGDIGIRSVYTGFRDKGAVFENYVYLMIKNKNPKYFYVDGIELDFIFENINRNKTLLECKYNSQLNQKQRELFDKSDAEKKLIINGYKSLALLD
jgi:predicted AAA+ superfamily ATPase